MAMQDRRGFLGAASAIAIGGAFAWPRFGWGEQKNATRASAKSAALPTASLGPIGRTVPRLGIGCAPLARLKGDDAKPIAILRRAFDCGVRYIDTAPTYSRGRSERLIGEALQGYDRRDFFIATKALDRGGDDARRGVEGSLKRLRVERIDLLQVHAVAKDWKSIFGNDAVLKALETARQEGLIGHLGITGHQNPKYLIEAIRRYPFATALVPVNPLDTKYLSFIREFLPFAKERGMAVIAMKVFAGGGLLADGRFTAAECLHYALSQDAVSVAVPGCDAIEHVDEACAAVTGFKLLSAEQQAALEARAGEHKGRKSEWYKEADD